MARVDYQYLDSQQPLIDEQGRATPYFLSWLQGATANGAENEDDVLGVKGQVQAIKDSVDALKLRNLVAGAGLTGGGTLEADREFIVGAGSGIAVDADAVRLNAGIDLLTDVDTSTVPPTNGQALLWDDAADLWKPGTVSGGGGGGSSLVYAAVSDATNGATLNALVPVHVFAVPGGALTKKGDYFEVDAFFDWASSTNGTKAIDYRFGGVDTGGQSLSSSGNRSLFMRLQIMYLTDTTFRLYRHAIPEISAAFGTQSNPGWVNMIQTDITMTTGSFSAGFSMSPSVRSNIASHVRCTAHLVKKQIAP